MSTSGLHTDRAQLLARWKSAIATHYAQQAPLATITADVKRRRLESGIDEELRAISYAVEKLLREKQESDRAASQLCDSTANQAAHLDRQTRLAVQQDVEAIRRASETGFVQHVCKLAAQPRDWHRSRPGEDKLAPKHWRAVCGWHYAFAGRASRASQARPEGAKR